MASAAERADQVAADETARAGHVDPHAHKSRRNPLLRRRRLKID
jgi:hypothetical protein